MLENIFDSHAHYDDKRFGQDREELLERLHRENVCAVMNVGCSLKTCKDSIALANKFPFVYAAVGIHPGDCVGLPEGYLDQLEQMAKENDKVKAIGEIGLDYHYDDTPKEIQKIVFEQQLILAAELSYPVIIHEREAHADTLELLKRYRPKGVVHCFSGSGEFAKEILKLGMYLGFTGVVTFANARKPVSAVEQTPLDRLLLETDCPYLAPVPFRGKRCDSSMIEKTAERIAQIKGTDPQKVVDQARENTCRLFSISL